MSRPVRTADLLAGGVASTFGAGLFVGLAPAAALAGPWLLASFVLAAGLGYLAVLSTSERPLDMAPAPVRRAGFALYTVGRLAAAIAVAGTFGAYVTPGRPALGGLVLVLVVTAVTIVTLAGPPAVLTRVAAVLVLACLAAVVAACVAIAPVALAVPAPDPGSPLGVLLAAGLLTVCFLGAGSGSAESPESPESPASGGAGPRPAGRVGRGPLAVVVVVVAGVCLAVAWAALHQLGAPRLAVSPAPLLDALAAADGAAMRPLLFVGVAVGCGFAMLGIVRGLRVPGIPAVRVVGVAGVLTAVGCLLVPPTTALATAAVLLLSDAALRYVAVRSQRSGVARYLDDS